MQVGVVIAGDPWRFFLDIFQDWKERYQVNVFERREINSPFFHTRINRYVFQRDLETFLAAQDVVFFEWASELLVEASKLPKKVPIVTRLHRYELFQWANQVNWDHVDQIILVSQAMQRKFAERFPEHAHKTVVTPVSVDLDTFQPVKKPFNGDIGTLCFLNPRKRVYELVLAFAALDRQRPDFRLHIGGGSHKYGDYGEALHYLVENLGLQDKVIFYGEVKKPAKWYQNIDIFVSNSYSEGLQVAPMEAMASGRYTLSHHWDGAEELVPEENLYWSDEELIEKILSFADCPENEKQRQQAHMRQLAEERFNLEQVKHLMRQVVEAAARQEAVKG